jgi:ABC-type sugar transport system permease subunit
MSLSRQRRWAPYLFISPFVLLFAAFWVYPLLRSLLLSFSKTAGPGHEYFIGLDNYAFLLRDTLFWKAVGNTLCYAAAFVGIQIPVALILALMLNHPRLRLRGVFRYAFFSPHLVGGVFVAVMFSLLLSQRRGLITLWIDQLTSAIHGVLPFIPATGTEINWLGRPNLAMPAVVLASLWLSIGYAMIYLLAALQAVDHELYEAADMDGAGRWQRFWHITLPGIRPTLTFLLLMGTIGAFQLFELPYVLFQGGAGPDNSALTIVMYLYQQGFETGDLGFASAIGWVLVTMILAISLIQVRATRATRDD